MKSVTMKSSVCKMKNFFSALSKTNLKGDYSLKFGVYRDSTSNIPSCTHSFQGSVKCGLLKMIAVLSLAVFFISSITTLISCVRD